MNNSSPSIKELIQKSREALLAAVQIYNNPNITFKSETYITLAVIAWTYLMHAYYRSIHLEYRYYRGSGPSRRYDRTKGGSYKYWELERCLNEVLCPLEIGIKDNLRFLIGIRHEIEHQLTHRIDEYISAKLHACALNFNAVLCELFGSKYSLADDLALVIQFSEISPQQIETQKDSKGISDNVINYIVDFEENLGDIRTKDTKYAYRVLYSQLNANRIGQADKVIEFVSSDSPLAEGLSIQYVHIKETERKKFLPKRIVQMMQEEGYLHFKMNNHVDLWKQLDAKNPSKGFGTDVSGQWYWYEKWVDVVRKHCFSNSSLYK